MAEVVINEQHLVDIADKIRSLNGSTETYKPGEMATAIRELKNEDDEVLRYLNDTATTFSNSNLTSLKQYAFEYRKKLTSVSLPNVTTIGQSAFQGCSNLTSINLPKLEAVEWQVFGWCTALTEVTLPNVTEVSHRGFSNCSSLKKVDLPKVKRLSTLAFNESYHVEHLILRNNEVCTFSDEDDWFRWGRWTDVHVYVPRALIDSYKDFYYLRDGLRAIEDYPDICG